jgi:hypothetical protein
MDTIFIRGLLFPPTVIALLVALFQTFGVLDMLFASDEWSERVVAARVVADPVPSEPGAEARRTAATSTALPTPFSPSAARNTAPATSESATAQAASATPSTVPVATVPVASAALLPSVANSTAISDAVQASDLSFREPVSPMASNDAYAQGEPPPEAIEESTPQSFEVPPTEMVQQSEDPAAQEPVVEQFVAELQQQPQPQ